MTRNILNFPIALLLFVIIKIFFLEKLLIKIFNKNHSVIKEKNRSINIFWKSIFFLYYNFLITINDRNLKRFIYSSYLKNSNKGIDVAKLYYEKNNHLKKSKKVKSNYVRSSLIFDCYKKNIKPIIKKYKNKVCLLQIGSSSGRDLEFLNHIESKVNFISVDLTREILNFQKKFLNIKNIEYFKMDAENVYKIFKKKKYEDNYKIIFAIGSIQYLPPHNFKVLLKNLKNISKVCLIIKQPVDASFLLSKKLFAPRGNFAFQYKYSDILKKYGFKILRKKITKNKTPDYFVHAYKD